MFSALLVIGYVAAFAVPGSCCRPKEYRTRDGQCCPMCHEGTVVRKDCTSQSGTRCGPCGNGTFMNKPNGLTKCFPCTACDPGSGLFAQKTCTIATDTVCGVLDGFFCKSFTDESGCGLAEKHAQCAPGQEIKEHGTSKTNTVCEDCQRGYFSLHGVNCTAWKICSDTKVKTKEGSTSSDVVCSTASRQHYSFIYISLMILTFLGFVVRGYVTSVKGKRQGTRLQNESNAEVS